MKKKYPEKKIILNTPEDPAEIVCETRPGKNKSEAVAVIDRTRLHDHQKLTEIYEIIKGELTMHIDGREYLVKEGERIEMKPGTRHYAVGKETWIKVYAVPGWTPEDHILVFEDRKVSREVFDRDNL